MAANPRKFSEKIALMRAKEAEGDAAFHQILTEVSGITKTNDTHIPAYGGLKNLIPHGTAPYAPFKGGSLPNINHSLQQQQQQMQQQQQRQHSPSQSQMSSPHAAPQSQQQSANQHTGSSGIDLKSAISDLNSLNGGDIYRRRFLPQQYGNGVAGMRPQRNRASEHAPYSPYLTPHPLSASDCKKFKSDSDIHGSVKHQIPGSGSEGSANSGLISPMIHRRVLEVGGNPNSPMVVGGNSTSQKSFPEGGSFTLNGIQPMPTQMTHAGMSLSHQMTLSHTSQHHGSLPDLSNLGFNSNSPSQPPANSPSHGPCSPPNDGFGRMVSTSMPPPDSPSSLRPNSIRHPSPFIGSPTQLVGIPQHFQYFPQSGLPMHPLGPAMSGPPAHLTHNNTLSHSIPLSQQSPKSPAALEKQLVNETIRRRISDKVLAQQQAQQYRQNSENVPSPSSPGTPPIRSPESVGGNSQHGDSLNYALSPGSHSSLQQQFDQVKMEGHSVPVTANSNHYTNGSVTDSPFIHDHRPPMKQHSIPNIVLTGVDDNYGQFFDKEFRPTMSMSDSFDTNDMFGTDEQFRADLTPIDLEGLQMLDDPSNVLTDPNTEDQLRLS